MMLEDGNGQKAKRNCDETHYDVGIFQVLQPLGPGAVYILDILMYGVHM